MRTAVLGLLAAVIPGCNSWFGLDPTVPVDAGADVIDATAFPTARLTWLVAETETTGLPAAVPTTAAIAPAPVMLQVGTITGPLSDVSASYAADGAFELPVGLPDDPWRLVFQLPGEIPHEVQWAPPADRVAHMTVPMFGRLDRPAIPGASSAVSVTPTGSPAQHTSPRVFTTGAWSELAVPTTASATVTFGMAGAIPFSGTLGAPDEPRGDRLVLVDYATFGNGCRASTGATDFPVTLTAGTVSPSPAPAWSTGVTGVKLDIPVDALTRIGASLGGGTLQRRWLYGRSPSPRLPAFTQQVFGATLLVPAMMTVLDCTSLGVDQVVVETDAMKRFPGFGYVQFTTSRTVMGGTAVLTSGVAAATTSSSNAYVVDTSVSIPVSFTFGEVPLDTTDQVQVPAGAHLELAFENDGAAGSSAHYYDVVLHRVATATQPLRLYRVTEPSVMIDTAVFADDPAGSEYVFEVRAYKGAPQASVGDFTQHEPTQSYASVFTHTFLKP